MISDEGIAAAVQWWNESWMLDDKRDAFKHALESVIRRDVEQHGKCHMYMDYDPQGPLLEAVCAAGVECRGAFFSGDGLFRWRKNGLDVEEARVTAKHGYGQEYLEIWPNRDPSLPAVDVKVAQKGSAA